MQLLNDLLIATVIMFTGFEGAELIFYCTFNGFQFPKKITLTEDDFKSSFLGLYEPNRIMYFRNGNYSHISKSVCSLFVKYHVVSDDYLTLYRVFRFSKNSKLINSQFKKLKKTL
jgi:hypothetical protein